MSKIDYYYRLEYKKDTDGKFWSKAVPLYPFDKVLEAVSTPFRQDTINAAARIIVSQREELAKIKCLRNRARREQIIF